MLGYHSEILEDANAHNALSFYTRHNPHPGEIHVLHAAGAALDYNNIDPKIPALIFFLKL